MREQREHARDGIQYYRVRERSVENSCSRTWNLKREREIYDKSQGVYNINRCEKIKGAG